MLIGSFWLIVHCPVLFAFIAEVVSKENAPVKFKTLHLPLEVGGKESSPGRSPLRQEPTATSGAITPSSMVVQVPSPQLAPSANRSEDTTGGIQTPIAATVERVDTVRNGFRS